MVSKRPFMPGTRGLVRTGDTVSKHAIPKGARVDNFRGKRTFRRDGKVYIETSPGVFEVYREEPRQSKLTF
ncbi:MAG: hypothetical protein V1493_00580 [Candidatus Diapherotrites archaeon]